MQTTVQIKLMSENPQSLIEMMRNFNAACNWLSEKAFGQKVWGWLPLQKAYYYELRSQFGLSSAQSLVCIRKVAYAYKNSKHSVIQFKPLGAIPLHAHRYKRDGSICFYGFRVPFKASLIIGRIDLATHHQATS